MEILLIRHGQSEADLLDVHEGRADYALTDLGSQQAELLAAWVKTHYPPDLVWTSPLRRARQVADVLGAATGVSVEAHDGLMEWDNGVLAGLNRQKASALYPEPPGGRKPYEPIPEGESQIAFRSRVELAWSEIIDRSSPYRRIAIVTHGGTITNLMSAFLRLPVTHDYAFATGDTGCHLLVRKGDRNLVMFLNRQDHLRDD